jgi:hypothetical protein
MRAVILISLIVFAVTSTHSSPPIVVQAANATATTTTGTATSTSSTSTTAAANDQSIPDAIKQLEQIKAANDEVLAKQKTALEKLDELQDAADQLRIFAKRG